MPEPISAFTSRVIPLAAENVDTDQIIPARYLKTTDKSGLADGLFHDWRFTSAGKLREPPFVLDQPGMPGRRILLAGANFGPGSSREHAPWALLAWGIRAVISTGFADIFRANALKNGLLPIVVSPERHAALFRLVEADPDVELTVDLPAQEVRVGTTGRGLSGGGAVGGRLTGGAAGGSTGSATAVDSFSFEIDPFSHQMLLEGTDEIGYVLGRLPSIEDWEAAHPARVNTLG
ncbi:MAG: 3-isopropylmalate dehydratase small subunit [Candidatus Limnocylindrales bacterium]